MSVSRWSVWLANLDPVLGSEQGRTRPVLVISETAINDVLPVVDALPVTSRKANRRIYPNEALVPRWPGRSDGRFNRVVLPDKSARQEASRSVVRHDR